MGARDLGLEIEGYVRDMPDITCDIKPTEDGLDYHLRCKTNDRDEAVFCLDFNAETIQYRHIEPVSGFNISLPPEPIGKLLFNHSMKETDKGPMYDVIQLAVSKLRGEFDS